MIDRNELVAVLAKAQDADYFLDEVARWESKEDWEREAHPDNYPDMAYEDLRDFQRVADAILDIMPGRTEREVGMGWADYFEQYDQHVGAEPLTPMLMCRILRGPRPFGIAQGKNR